MLPKSLIDKQVRFFKFWFNHQLQNGLHYQNELFHQLQTADSEHRLQLYRLGSQLAQQGADILITHRHSRYSLWVSLRSQPYLLQSLQNCMPPPAQLQSVAKGSPRPDAVATFSTQRSQPEAAATLLDSQRKVIGR